MEQTSMTQHPEHIGYILGIAGALWLIYFYCSTVKVLRVVDGDGFVIRVRHGFLWLQTRDQSIRLARDDAEEKGQAYGQKCREALQKKIEGKRVWIHKEATDKYGRWVCMVYDIWGCVNQHQVFWGWAWNYAQYGGRYYWEERFARTFRLGLWKQKNPTPPWEWRKKKQAKVIEMPIKKKVKSK